MWTFALLRQCSLLSSTPAALNTGGRCIFLLNFSVTSTQQMGERGTLLGAVR